MKVDTATINYNTNKSRQSRSCKFMGRYLLKLIKENDKYEKKMTGDSISGPEVTKEDAKEFAIKKLQELKEKSDNSLFRFFRRWLYGENKYKAKIYCKSIKGTLTSVDLSANK